MQVERWRRVEDVFHAAARLTAAERIRLLDESCGGDHALRAEVESLLTYEASAGAFIEAPALDVAARLMAGDRSLTGASLSGTTIGHFRVLEQLGEGGMGVVYEAIDTRLGRTVALKFLRASVSSPQDLERFEREARAASALNHPNICTIHSVQDAGGRPFIEMERLEGQTLRERIAAGALAVDDVVATALQMVDALDAAHARGIVHRDLKPGNVFCTVRGIAKILDFGIAQIDAAPDDDRGAVVGTAGYMSPEQASGQIVDSRTDLFSLGAVIYEMATGHAAFHGSSSASIRQAILDDEPIPPRQLNPAVPAALERIILNTLRKDRGLRCQSASGLRADLERLRHHAIRRRRGTLSAAVILLMLLAGGLAWRYSPPGLAGMFNGGNLRVRQLTRNTAEGSVGSGAISPDGRLVAYTDPRGIYVREIETGETRKVPESGNLANGTRWDLAPGWLPDGTRFVVNLITGGSAADSTVWLVGISQVPRKLRDGVLALAVSPDGSWIAFARDGRINAYRSIWLMNRDGEIARQLLEADAGRVIVDVSWSPDSRRVAYVHAAETGGGASIDTRDLAGGAASTILRAEDPEVLRGHAWLRDGRLVYSVGQTPVGMSAGAMPCTHWQMRLDTATGEPRGRSSPLAGWLPQCVWSLSLSADGTRVSYLLSALQDVIHVADLAPGGHAIASSTRFTLTEGRNIPSGWTSDSQAIVWVSDGSGRPAIVRQRIDAETPQPITVEPEPLGAARLTPDGGAVIYQSLPSRWSGRQRLMLVPMAGGSVREIATGTFVDGGARCAVLPSTRCAIAERSSDGTQLVFTAIEVPRGRGHELARVAIQAGGDYRWALSPDGARIAVLDARTGRIHVLSLAGMPPHEFAIKGRDTLGYVSWTADAQQLIVPSVDARGATLLIVDLQGTARVLWHEPGALDISGIPSPDGRRVAIWVRSRDANLWLAESP